MEGAERSHWTMMPLVFIIGSKLYHFFCDDEKVQMGRLRGDAQLKMSTVSAQVPLILLLPRSSKRKVAAQTRSDFSLSN